MSQSLIESCSLHRVITCSPADEATNQLITDLGLENAEYVSLRWDQKHQVWIATSVFQDGVWRDLLPQ